MRLLISSKKGLMSMAFNSHIVTRFQSALDRFSDVIRQVKIHLEDLNGPKGGLDKRCRAVVQLSRGGTLAIETVSTDAYASVDNTAERVKRAVSRRLDRFKPRRIVFE